MSSAPEKLQWPPSKEDLEKLYVGQHLSAMKIARVYGLEYKNSKTAESTVLYQLKKNGLKRRDAAENIRNVTEEMVDEWVRRYQAGESLKEIAGSVVTRVTVWNHLKSRGIVLRDKVEAQIAAVTKYVRLPFTGNEPEQNYLLGFVLGDCSVERHGRGIRVRSGSTHPLFVKLFANLFTTYGHVRTYPKEAELGHAELNLEVDLDGSFEFLLLKSISPTSAVPAGESAFLSFLGGFLDAEGTIHFHRKVYSSSFEIYFTNTDKELLLRIQQRLASLGYHARIYHWIQRAGRLESGTTGEVWRLALHHREEVRKLLSATPLRHEEKKMKSKLALSFLAEDSVLDSEGLPEGWRAYVDEIKLRRREFVSRLTEALRVKGGIGKLQSVGSGC